MISMLTSAATVARIWAAVALSVVLDASAAGIGLSERHEVVLNWHAAEQADKARPADVRIERFDTSQQRFEPLAEVPADAPAAYTDVALGARIDPSDPTPKLYRLHIGDAAPIELWSPYACGVEPAAEHIADGLRRWNAVRRQQQGAVWQGPVPTVSGGMQILSHAGLWLLAQDYLLALFDAATGALVGLTDWRYGMEFIRKPQATPGEIWRLYLGDGSKFPSGRTGHIDQVAYSDLDLVQSLPNPHAPEAEDRGGANCGPIQDAGQTVFRCQWQRRGFTVENFWRLDTRDAHGRNGLKGRLKTSSINRAGHGIVLAQFPFMSGFNFYPDAASVRTDVVIPAGNWGTQYPNPYGATSEAAIRTISAPGKAPTSQEQPRGLGGALFDSSALAAPFAGFVEHDAQGSPIAALYMGYEAVPQRPLYFRTQNNFVNSATFFEFYPERDDGEGTAGLPGNSLDSDYAAVLMPLCADAYTIAKRYRAFALTAPWTHAGAARTQARTALPQQLRDGLFWWLLHVGRYDYSDVGTGELSCTGPARSGVRELIPFWYDLLAARMAEDIGPRAPRDGRVPIAFVMYAWQKGSALDDCMPLYNPRDGLLGDPEREKSHYFARLADRYDAFVVPYLNPNYIDSTDRPGVQLPHKKTPKTEIATAHGQWNRYGALAKQTPRGRLYDHPPAYPKPSILSLIDPSQPNMQQHFAATARRIFDMGAQGIYLDTFGGNGEPDFAHGHRGPGRWIVDSNRDMLAAIEQAADAGSKPFFAVEHFNDAFIAQQGPVLVSTTPDPDHIGLLPAVYSDYQIMVGPRVAGGEDVAAFAMKIARGFLWGAQLRLMNHADVDTVPTRSVGGFEGGDAGRLIKLDYLRTLVHARLQLKDYLAYGEYLGPVAGRDSSGGPIEISAQWCVNSDQDCLFRYDVPQWRTATAPAVQGARWLAPDGRRAIILTNIADRAHEVRIPIAGNWRGLAVAICEPDGEDCDQPRVAAADVTLRMPAHAVKVLQFSTPTVLAAGAGER